MGIETGRVVGFYDNRKIRQGDEFEIKSEEEFSFRWMVPVDWEPSNPPPDWLPQIRERDYGTEDPEVLEEVEEVRAAEPPKQTRRRRRRSEET
jgi:hypothetical protein